VWFLLALVLPGIAVARATKSINIRYVAAYIAAISAITAYSYWADKRKARDNAWRTPEHVLHSLELMGGWASAFLSQRAFRHKTVKEDYQSEFWMIAVLHQYVSADYLNHWRCTAAIYKFIEPLLK
jgi:uncharacterized membrane protein YsdA (DUF1294 family)